jgi:hypothetical protein
MCRGHDRSVVIRERGKWVKGKQVEVSLVGYGVMSHVAWCVGQSGLHMDCDRVSLL